MKSKALAVLLRVLFFSAASRTQEKAQDRRKFLDPKTQVSDDPRRGVVKAGPRGPEGTLVLPGGRIFDGTGGPPREGTQALPPPQKFFPPQEIQKAHVLTPTP